MQISRPILFLKTPCIWWNVRTKDDFWRNLPTAVFSDTPTYRSNLSKRIHAYLKSLENGLLQNILVWLVPCLKKLKKMESWGNFVWSKKVFGMTKSFLRKKIREGCAWNHIIDTVGPLWKPPFSCLDT